MVDANHVIDVATRILTLRDPKEIEHLQREIDLCKAQLDQRDATGTPDPKRAAAAVHAALMYAIKIFHATTGHGKIAFTEDPYEYMRSAEAAGIAPDWMREVQVRGGAHGGGLLPNSVVILTIVMGSVATYFSTAIPLILFDKIPALSSVKYPNLARAAFITLYILLITYVSMFAGKLYL